MPAGATIDPLQALANALAPAPTPFIPYRKGKVSSIVSGSGASYVYITVDGTVSTPRKAQWQGSGSFPAPGQFVYYIEHSPLPLVVGVIPEPNADHDMGDGNVSAGGFIDDSGNLRDGITGNTNSLSSLSASLSSLSSTVSGHTSTLSTLNSTVSGHTTSINSHTNSITALNTSAATALATNNAQQVTINAILALSASSTLVTTINSLLNRVANLESLLTYYAGNMDYLARLGAHYSNHTGHPPGPF